LLSDVAEHGPGDDTGNGSGKPLIGLRYGEDIKMPPQSACHRSSVAVDLEVSIPVRQSG